MAIGRYRETGRRRPESTSGGSVLPDETHGSTEALIVLQGELNLQVAGKTISIGPGETFIVPPGQSHSVEPGSLGTLIIIDT
jgi:quercetin dioxygenase-like cupin family protein